MTDQEQNNALQAQYLECRKSLQTYEARKANPAATAEELLAPVIASEVRAERNKRLADSDWRVTYEVEKASIDGLGIFVPTVWTTYRQALRDITSQAGFPWEVVWPTEP